MIFLLQLLQTLSTVEVVSGLVVAVLVALISLGIIGKKLAPVIKAFNEALELYAKSKSPESDGGSRITEAERQKLRERALDIFVTAWEQYKDSFIGWLTQLFNKKK